MEDKPRFAADRMVIRLARWLRLLGADVISDPDIGGAELLNRARAERRILLTRDKRLRTAPDALFIASNDLRGQLAQVIHHFRIDPRSGALTRCSLCNQPLISVPKEAVARRVPPFVFASNERFAECERCGRIYWTATHPERINAMLDSMGV
ncbi:MAG TPA: Mut7-C RNAse domain-containing protein [Candidatus Binataceae bacterium]|nr:Mut7-C RNAse domain-containing protein [Candidatus Binataceae bacterium]